jgi:hypothetical protein
VTTYIFLKGNCQKVCDDISITLGNEHPDYSTVKNWVDGFKTGHVSTEDEERSGRTTQDTVPENLDAFHSMILDDRKLSAKKIVDPI